MIKSLPEADEKHQNPREEYVDDPLGVAEWEINPRRREVPDVEPGAPSWWRGEEDASQSFFKAMGIDPRKV